MFPMIAPPRHPDRMWFNGSGARIVIDRTRCQQCAHCDHTVSVVLSTDDAPSLTVGEPYAEVLWEVAKNQVRP